MAPQTAIGPLGSLRAASSRLAVTSVSELPRVVSAVARDLREGRDILCQPHTSKQSDGEAGVVVHRINTQVATLLQGRSTEERFAAVVLIKTLVEAGGWEILSKCKHWVTGLMSNLKKPDPSSMRALAVVTITRIFMLTWEFPTLIREVTTPCLTGFISTCLNIMQSRQCSVNERQTIFESMSTLVPKHPTVFRSHLKDITHQLESLLPSPGPELADQGAPTYAESLKAAAFRLSTLLHQCEPKQGSSTSWEKSLEAQIKTVHALLDQILVGVDEDWSSVAQTTNDKQSLRKSYDRMDASQRTSAIYRVSGTLSNSIDRMIAVFAAPTAAPVNISVGAITDLVMRIFASTISARSSRGSIRFNADVSKEERDAFYSIFPAIHVHTMSLVAVLAERAGEAFMPLSQTLLDQITWVFSSEYENLNIRTASYTLVKQLLELAGPNMTKESIEQLGPIIKHTCNDLLPADTPAVQAPVSDKSKPSVQANADSFLRRPGQTVLNRICPPGLINAANALLPTLLSRLPADQIPEARRAQIDRTAILTRHKDALIASVLNPVTKPKAGHVSSSLLPFLAREFPHDPAVEAVLRPRMPVIRTKTGPLGEQQSTHYEDDNMDEDEDVNQDEDEDEIYEEEMVAIEDVQRILSPSHSPNPARDHDKETQELVHAEQAVIDAALASYQEAHEQSQLRKRPTEAPEPEAKRLRASPVAQSLVAEQNAEVPSTISSSELPRTVEVGQDVVTMAAETAQVDSDDDDFVVPPLDLVDSSDEEDE